MATLTFQNIKKNYGEFEVIKDFSLDIADREFVVIVGPSGCGKSTLIRMIAGLEEISGGTLFIDGQPINNVGPANRGLAMVFQSYALYPHMSVRENMSFALRLARVSKAERDQKVLEAARILHMEDLLDRKPGQLSGGQRQRVAIGRAIVRQPKAFLFDEPLSNLDAALRAQMRVELARLHEALEATMIYVTHDQVEAMTMADRIVVLNAGGIEQVGTPLDIYQHPKNLFVARFMGSPQINLLPGRVTGMDADLVSIELTAGLSLDLPTKSFVVKPNDLVTVGIRPEGLRPDPLGTLGGISRLIERLGATSLLHVDLYKGVSVVAQLGSADPTRPHQPVRLAIDPECCHLFDWAGRAIKRGLENKTNVT